MTRDITIILGRTGSGKTWWARLAAAAWGRKLIYDPAGAFETEYIPDRTMSFTQFLELQDAAMQGNCPPLFNYGTLDPGLVPDLCNTAFICGNCLLVLEESSTLWGKGERIARWLSRLIFLGRHQAVSMMVIAQRPASIPIDLRSQANRVICFASHEEDDIIWLSRFIRKDNLSILPTLPKFVCFDSHNGELSTYSIAPQIESVYGLKLDKGQSVGIDY